MRFRSLLLSTVCLCLLAAGSYYLDLYRHEPEGSGMVGRPLLPDRHLGKVAIVVLEGPEGQVTLRRTLEGWTVDEHQGRPADEAKLTALLHLLKSTTVDQRVPSSKENLATFGLLRKVENGWLFERGRTAKVISLYYGAESRNMLLYRLLVGKSRTVNPPEAKPGSMAPPSREGTYVRFPSTNQVYMVGVTLPLETDARAWVRP